MAQQIINVDDTATAMMLAELKQNAGGALVIHEETVNKNGATISTLDKTWKEIYDAVMSGVVPVLLSFNDESKRPEDFEITLMPVQRLDRYSDSYKVFFTGISNYYETAIADDYPKQASVLAE